MVGSRSPVRRKRFAVTAAALLLVASGTGWRLGRSGSAALSRADRPNIVFVLTDDLTWNLVRYMPHVLAMERAGATFSNYFVTDSLCCPSRTSIMTGLLPHDSGVFSNGGRDGGFAAFLRHDNEHRTFAVALQNGGYRTAMMGKYLNGYLPGYRNRARLYLPPGWNDWAVTGNGYSEFDYALNENRHLVRYGRSPRKYLTNVLSGLASSFVSDASPRARSTVRTAGHRPFLVEVATFAPHAPYVYAPSDANRFDDVKAPEDPAFDRRDSIGNPKWLDLRPLAPEDIRRLNGEFRNRVRAVQAVDRMIGRLQHQLVTEGLANNTYLVFSSDNGYHMGEHRLEAGKMTAFDTDIRVPLIIDGPGIHPGTRVSALAENIDLAPTFDQLAGLTPPSTMDGRSLVPLLGEGHTPPSWRRAVLVEHHGPDIDPADPDYPGANSGNPPSYEAVRLANAVYVEYVDGEREYYDIAADPYELRNLYTNLSRGRRSVLHRQLLALEQCHGATACQAADRFETPTDRATG